MVENNLFGVNPALKKDDFEELHEIAEHLDMIRLMDTFGVEKRLDISFPGGGTQGLLREEGVGKVVIRPKSITFKSNKYRQETVEKFDREELNKE